TAVLAGTAAAAGIAWINSVGNLAGFFGPSIVGVITDLTKRTDYGLYVASAMLLVGAALVLAFVPKRYQVDLVSPQSIPSERGEARFQKENTQEPHPRPKVKPPPAEKQKSGLLGGARGRGRGAPGGAGNVRSA